MTELAEKWFNGTDLGRYGLCTSAVSGVHDSGPGVIARQYVAGSDTPTDTILRADLVAMVFNCAVYGDDHADLIRKLKVLKPLMSHRLGWCEFRIEDRPGERTLAASKGFPVKIDSIPYLQTMVEFTWQLERLGFWEDAEAQVATDPTSINNTGDMACYPIFTCTAINAMGSGLHFHVGSSMWTYATALAPADVLLINTEAMTCHKNGTLDMAGVDDDAVFPELAVGANTISKSSADFTLGASWRRKKE